MQTIRVTGNNSHLQELIKLLDIELNTRYGLLQAQYDKFNRVESIETAVIGFIDSKPCGCGCFKAFNKDTVEIKRMFVKADFRGKGISKLILAELENWAGELGFSKAILETGIKQPDAIKFYSKLGYRKIDNFGQYIGNSNSVCFTKKI